MSQINPDTEEPIVLEHVKTYKITVSVVVLDFMVDPAVNQSDSD